MMEKIERTNKENELVRARELNDKLFEIYHGSKSSEIIDHVADFADELKKRHPDCYDVLLFRILGGGTPMDWQKFDFEGEDSVEAFINRIHAEVVENK